MQTILNKLNNSVFTFENKRYKVTETSIKSEKAVIITDKRSWVLYSHELDAFMDKVSGITYTDSVGKKEPWLPSNEIVSEMTPLKAEIIHTNEQSRRITDKLEAVFNELSTDPKEETYKKARAMVDASNAIVNMQLANYKFLSLK